MGRRHQSTFAAWLTEVSAAKRPDLLVMHVISFLKISTSRCGFPSTQTRPKDRPASHLLPNWTIWRSRAPLRGASALRAALPRRPRAVPTRGEWYQGLPPPGPLDTEQPRRPAVLSHAASPAVEVTPERSGGFVECLGLSCPMRRVVGCRWHDVPDWCKSTPGAEGERHGWAARARSRRDRCCL